MKYLLEMDDFGIICLFYKGVYIFVYFLYEDFWKENEDDVMENER